MLIEFLTYIIPYFLLVLLLVWPLIFKKGGKNNYYWLCVIVLASFSAFRYGVGWDYFNYYNAILAADWQVYRMEPLMRWLALYCSRIGNPHLFIFVTGSLTVLLYSIVIYKKSTNPIVSLLVFLCLPCLFLSGLSIVRFSLSVAILFFASLYHRKPIVYFCLVVVAFLTHRARDL